MAQYQAEFKPENDVIVVTFPDLGYGATQGSTESEALEMAEDFLLMAVGDLIKQGKTLPAAKARHEREADTYAESQGAAGISNGPNLCAR